MRPPTVCAEGGAPPAIDLALRGMPVSPSHALPQAPARFTCPLSGCLMLEPVTLVNVGRVRQCPCKWYLREQCLLALLRQTAYGARHEDCETRLHKAGVLDEIKVNWLLLSFAYIAIA